MAIKTTNTVVNGTAGGDDLRLASNITKRNLSTAITVGGSAGQVAGFWQAMIVQFPAGWASNQAHGLMGFDSGQLGAYGGGNDSALMVFGDTFGTTSLRLRPRSRYNGSGANSVPNLDATGFAQLQRGVPMLLLMGIANTGSATAYNATDFRHFVAVCPINGGTVESLTQTPTAAYLTNSGTTLLQQLITAQGTGLARTPANFTFEHVAFVNGDFPWDTANGRPHHDAIAALANGAGAPAALHTYETLVLAQNAGTLTYANLRSGRGNLDFWWKLTNKATGRVNSGSGAANTLAYGPTVGTSTGATLADASTIAPSHWSPTAAPTITEPTIKFHGGRGVRALALAGTYGGLTTALQRRWEYDTGAVNEGAVVGAVVPGFDWADVTAASGAWSLADTLPVGGPYRLRVRDKADTANEAASSGDWLVGTVMLNHCQSGAAISLNGGQPVGPLGSDMGANNLSATVDALAQGLNLRLQAMDAGGATYVQPQVRAVRMTPGSAPSIGHGAIRALNEWNAVNPRHPLLIANQAMNGTAQSDWAQNAFAYSSNGTSTVWRFIGSKGVPGVSDPGGVGVAGYFAFLLRSYVDVHNFMWYPGIAAAATGTGSRAQYVSAIDALYDQSPSAPWLIYPPWRGHRDPSDSGGVDNLRDRHVQFVAELGSRGILAPHWGDIVSDTEPTGGSTGPGSLHSAFNLATNNPYTQAGSNQVSDGNEVGMARLGRGIGRSLAWAFDRRVKAHGPRIVGAWLESPGVIRVAFSRQVRTLNGAAMANLFNVSVNDGAAWVTGSDGTNGFSAALASDGRSVALTKTIGTWPTSGLRVDYNRWWAFNPAVNQFETATERLLDGLLYDNQQHRGGTNFAAGQRTGNPLQGTSRVGAGVAGVAVASAKGSAKLVATERFAGNRAVTVRLMAADGVTVLREKTLAIAAS